MNDLTSNNTSKTTFAEKADSNFDVNLQVDDKPANIQLSARQSQAIAGRLSQSIANLPADDFMPDLQTSAHTQEEVLCRPTEALPKVIEMRPSQDFFVDVKWQQIKNLPGYMVSGIRNLGRDTFESFDCFKSFSEDQRKQGKDPLSEIMIMSDITHDKTSVNYFAKMIVENGVQIENCIIDHDQHIQDYKPEIIIMMTENYTFKLVCDRIENGAPVDLNSIYAWKGGLKNYRRSVECKKDEKLTYR